MKPNRNIKTAAAAGFWTQVNRFPPILCRLLARDGVHGAVLSDAEIAKRSGLAMIWIVAISEYEDWSLISLDHMRRFLTGCGIDFENRKQMHRIYCYLKNPTFKYLRMSPDWQSKYEPMLRRWRDANV